ncbi:MAG: M20/M25/M40 family metallo-hydrolase [Chloroflexi bacterium]|nr:M20/M25/M40 family metallo-hydrolase [Chloroflexota bacterium]
MTDLLPFLKSLLSVSGLSAHEAPIRALIADAWRPLSDEISQSRLGSLHALKRGSLPAPRPSVLFAAHMDAVGLMTSQVQGEFLRIAAVGGLDARILPGQAVIVHGRRDLPGVIVQPPAYLLPPENREGPVALRNLLVDVGLEEAEARQNVRTGDLISFAQPPIEMRGEALVGHSLDNRASVAALAACLQALQGRELAWDVWCAATVQEEETLAGAHTSGFQLRPSLAVAVDVTYGAGPGGATYNTFELGKGPTLMLSAVTHPALYRAFKELAERLEIPFSTEIMPSRTQTDADALYVAAEGIPSMVISIPARYLHSPVEMVHLKDIARVGRLLAEFAVELNADTLAKIAWDV